MNELLILIAIAVIVLLVISARKGTKPASLSPNQKKDTTSQQNTLETHIDSQNHTKSSLRDYFKIDITSISPKDGEKRLYLSEPELGIFHCIEFYFNDDGSINNLEFISAKQEFNQELIELINQCALTFGPTKIGETIITGRDIMLLKKGVFSRLWKDVWFDVSTDSETGIKGLTLTIFSVTKTANLQLNK
ncbi:MAG: hypothetical protein HDR79_07540 [Bacteroides sp.]|nr:hypothetical protein [Bacteroides sp.]